MTFARIFSCHQQEHLLNNREDVTSTRLAKTSTRLAKHFPATFWPGGAPGGAPARWRAALGAAGR